MNPLAALEEIAFLLERDLASPYRTKAFRGAAAAIEGVSEEELRTRAAEGSLKRIAGVGDRTAGVIAEALAGGVPEYLRDLREKLGQAVPDATGLHARLRGDLHSHSEWSDGTTPIATMARAADLVGLEYLVLTDHSPSLRVANGLSAERLAEQLDVLESLNASRDGGARVLSGIEVDILEDGSLDQTPAMLARLDVVVASVHSKLRSERAVMTERMLAAIEHPFTNVLGHCTGQKVEGGRVRPPSEFDAEAVFAACAEHDVAVEINSRPERRDPPDELIALAIEAGCLFSIDSDGHAPGHLSFLGLGAARAEAAGVREERIVTTWPVERLLEWSRAGRTAA